MTTRGLVHIYRAEGHDVAALSGVDLTVHPGEVVGLLGPSGAGKSTLLTLFGGLMRPSAGRVLVGEHELSTMSEADLDRFRAAEVGLVLQGAARNLLPYLTARQNVEFAQQLGPQGRPRGAAPRRGARARRPRPRRHRAARLAAAGPAPARGARGRARQPARACCSATSRPRQLHHSSRDLVLDTLHRVNQEWGTTVVVVTHDPEVAARLPRTVTIRDGRVGGEGRSGEAYAVVSADGSLPLPPAAVDAFPPGALVRVHEVDGVWTLIPQGRGETGE